MDSFLHFAGGTPILLMLAGFVIYWVAASRRQSANAWPSRLARELGVVCMLLGLFVFIGQATHIFLVVAWIATAIILITTMFRYYRSERHSLVWILMTAAEKGIPLNTAVMAFAEERNDRIGRQAAQLAEYLEAGVPLGLALRRSGMRVSQGTLLAAELGQQTGTLGLSLRHATQDSDVIERTLRSTAMWFFYLAFLMVYILALMGWSWQWIIPVMQHIYYDFEIEMPRVTVSLIEAVGTTYNRWMAVGLIVLLTFAMLAAACAMYAGASVRALPVVSHFWWRIDAARVMRWLAIGIRQNRPLPEMVQLLAGYFPRRRVRRALERSAIEIGRGKKWTSTLRKMGLIRQSESVLFESAERAGNLPWALDEMADSSVRRAAYRLRALIDIVFPLAVVAMGGIVLILAVGLLLPLFQLIVELS